MNFSDCLPYLETLVPKLWFKYKCMLLLIFFLVIRCINCKELKKIMRAIISPSQADHYEHLGISVLIYFVSVIIPYQILYCLPPVNLPWIFSIILIFPKQCNDCRAFHWTDTRVCLNGPCCGQCRLLPLFSESIVLKILVSEVSVHMDHGYSFRCTISLLKNRNLYLTHAIST